MSFTFFRMWVEGWKKFFPGWIFHCATFHSGLWSWSPPLPGVTVLFPRHIRWELRKISQCSFLMLKALDAAYWLVYLVGCIYYKYCFFYCLQFRQMLVGVPVSSLSLLGETSEQKLPWMEWNCGTARAGEGVFFCVLTDSRVISVLSYFPRDVIL